MKSPDTPSTISSPALADGASPSGSQDGQTAGQSGPAPAHASHSASKGRNLDSATTGISRQSSATSSRSVNLQSRLASRLQARLGSNGCPGYALTWRESAMKSGPPICALRASALRTSDNVFIGWQTPRARGDGGGQRWRRGEPRNLEDQARIFALNRGLTVEEVALLSVSPTFSRRLMGYPVEWQCCAVGVTPSSRSSQPNSSARS